MFAKLSRPWAYATYGQNRYHRIDLFTISIDKKSIPITIAISYALKRYTWLNIWVWYSCKKEQCPMDSWHHPGVVKIQLHVRSDSLFANSPNRVKDYRCYLTGLKIVYKLIFDKLIRHYVAKSVWNEFKTFALTTTSLVVDRFNLEDDMDSVTNHQISNTRRIKSQHLTVSRLALQLSLPNLFKTDVKSQMKML